MFYFLFLRDITDRNISEILVHHFDIFSMMYFKMINAKQSATWVVLNSAMFVHLSIYLCLVCFLSRWNINFKISERHSPWVTYGRSELNFFPITHILTCFVCVHDLKIIAWPVLTRSLERWIKISYLQAVASKADFHYLSLSWPPAPHTTLFFCIHTSDQTLTPLFICSWF